MKMHFDELYEQTIKNNEAIKNAGYNLTIMWEYDWKRFENSKIA